jgi:hypothetical protein
VLSLLLAGLVVAGCGADPRPAPRLAEAPEPAPAYDGSAEPAEAVLSLVPQRADVVTVTDWDMVRAELGQPDLTSEDLVSDRIDFWERVRDEAPTLTEGLLREEESRLWLDYGFTQDDVDWEAHFTGDSGSGFVVALRPDLDVAGVRRAIADGVGPLADAELRPEDHLVVSGVAETDVWASEPEWGAVVGEPAAATYLQRGCVPLRDALGPDAGAEEQQQLVAGHEVTSLAELERFAVEFGKRAATVRVEPGRSDLVDRVRLGEDWPVEGFPQTYVDGVAGPTAGRIDYTLRDPRAAVGLALREELPFAICNEVTPLEVPTG